MVHAENFKDVVMSRDIDLVFTGYRALSEEQKEELLSRIEKDLQVGGLKTQSARIKKGINLGPVSSNICPCCRK